MYKLIFSILIHEKLECVVDQILNYMHFNPGSVIVLHFSSNFDYRNSLISRANFEKCIKNIGNVFINPISVRTGGYDIIQAHLSNFEYINKKLDFKYFCMCASNELFVRTGLYEHIKEYDCGVDLHNDTDINTRWRAGIAAHNDGELGKILKELNSEKIMGSQVEGTFYRKELYSQIYDIINRNYDWHNMKVAYAREEVYFSTIVCALMKNQKIHVYNQGMFTWCPWKRQFTMNVRICEAKKIADSNENYFAIKRVERRIDDCMRAYIRQKNEYFEEEAKYLHIKKQTILQIYLDEIAKEIKIHLSVVKKGLKKLSQRWKGKK